MKRNQNIITRHFVKVIGELLSKFQADADKIENLLTIPLHFDFEIIQEEKCKEEYLDIVDTVKELLLNRVEEQIFANCSQVFKHFLSDKNPFQSETEIIFLQLLEELQTKIDDSLQSVRVSALFSSIWRFLPTKHSFTYSSSSHCRRMTLRKKPSIIR